MGQLDASIVTLTYRPLERSFHAPAAAVQWVSLSYLITLVCLLAPVGRRSDQKGRKLSYLHGFVIFTLGSAACGLAPSLPFLVGSRVVQGVGAAFIQANSVALVSNVAPVGRLRQALGAQAAAQALGLALGPTLGGLIVSSLGWRWVFAVNVPIGLVAMVGGILFLPRTTDRAPAGPTDWRGALLLGGAATAVLLALSAGAGLHLPAGLTLLLPILALTALISLRRHLEVTPAPILPRAITHARGMGRNLITALLAYWTLFGPLVLVPLVLEARGESSLRAGLVLSALPAGFAIAATLAGGALPRGWTDRHRAIFGAALTTLGLAAALLFTLTPLSAAVVLGIAGLGLGVLTPANNAQIMRAVPRDVAASAGAVLNMTRALGTALGIAVVTLALHLGGERAAVASLVVTAGLSLVIAAASFVSRSPGRIMPDDAERAGPPTGVPDSSQRG
jgi:MFS family permease